MLGGGLPGQLAAIGGAASSLTPAQVTQASNQASAPTNITANRTVVAADDGLMFTNTGAAVDVTLALTPGLRVGFKVALYNVQAATHNMFFTTSGGEVMTNQFGLVYTSIQTVTSSAAGCLWMEKVSSTQWGLISATVGFTGT